jgi:hypothetical protein
MNKILIWTSLDKNFITAWKSITKLVVFWSFVAKYCKMRIIVDKLWDCCACSCILSFTQQLVSTDNGTNHGVSIYTVNINDIENNTWVRGNTRFISSVEHDISRVSAIFFCLLYKGQFLKNDNFYRKAIIEKR